MRKRVFGLTYSHRLLIIFNQSYLTHSWDTNRVELTEIAMKEWLYTLRCSRNEFSLSDAVWCHIQGFLFFVRNLNPLQGGGRRRILFPDNPFTKIVTLDKENKLSIYNAVTNEKTNKKWHQVRETVYHFWTYVDFYMYSNQPFSV